LAEVVLLSYSCGLACKFHIHEVVVAPFDKAFLKCPAVAQVEVVISVNTVLVYSYNIM
jgi:hypothetical protein